MCQKFYDFDKTDLWSASPGWKLSPTFAHYFDCPHLDVCNSNVETL